MCAARQNQSWGWGCISAGPLWSLITLLDRLWPLALNHLRRDGSMASMAFMPLTSIPMPAPIGLYCFARSKTCTWREPEEHHWRTLSPEEVAAGLMIQGTRDLAEERAGRVADRWEHHAVHWCSHLEFMGKSASVDTAQFQQGDTFTLMSLTALMRPNAVDRPPGPPPIMTTSQSGGLVAMMLSQPFDVGKLLQTLYYCNYNAVD